MDAAAVWPHEWCKMSTRVLREPIVVTGDLVSRFFAKTVGSNSGCVIWTGSVQRNGYGAFKLNGRKYDSHVLSWRLANNGAAVPVGMLICHQCDCRCCVNPEHLMLGTASENMLHAHRNGRGEDFTARGTGCKNAVLNDDLVLRIRATYVPRKYSYRRIARELGVNERTVRSVVEGKTWKHVGQRDA